MKTITIKQPWASLICEGIKDVENRTWNTKFRGRVLIHASCQSWIWHKVINYLTPKMKEVFENNKYTGTWLKSLQTGAIIGSVEIVNCISVHRNVSGSKSIWAEQGSFHWILRNPILFPEPIPAKGKLSFWDYPGILAETEEKGGELFCHCQLPVKEINQVTGYSDDYRCRYCGGKWYK